MFSSLAGYNRFVYISAAIAALGGLLFGFDTGIISGALLFIREDLQLSEFLQSAVVSAILVGTIVGAGGTGPLADRFGAAQDGYRLRRDFHYRSARLGVRTER